MLLICVLVIKFGLCAWCDCRWLFVFLGFGLRDSVLGLTCECLLVCYGGWAGMVV